LEQQIYQESKTVTGQVSKRSDDVHGLGWGHVTTGFVSRKKLGFLQRAGSVDRDWSAEGSPAPCGPNRARGLRVTFADTPGSRPDSALATERVQEMDSQVMRAQTPPLAGEWPIQQSLSNGTASSSIIQSATQASSLTKTSSEASSSSSIQKMSSSKSSFSSSQKTSSFQSTSMQASQAFEAFPDMGGIENLKLEP